MDAGLIIGVVLLGVVAWLALHYLPSPFGAIVALVAALLAVYLIYGASPQRTVGDESVAALIFGPLSYLAQRTRLRTAGSALPKL